MKAIVMIAALLLLNGCATPLRPDEARIAISSNPPGATITSGNGSAPAPQTLVWTVPNGTGTSSPITATWVSGAKTTVRLNLIAGTEKTYVIQRPNVPGIDADIRWAVHLREQDAAASRALAEALSSTSKSDKTVRCTSTRIGIMVDTECR